MTIDEAGRAARAVAADALGVAEGAVVVEAAEPVEWPDAALGCPEPGMMYAQMLTPGYRVRVRIGEQVRSVHTDATGHGRLVPANSDAGGMGP